MISKYFLLKLLKIDNRLKKFLQLAISQSERRNEYKSYRKCFKWEGVYKRAQDILWRQWVN